MKLSQWNIWQRSAAVSALAAVAGAWSPAHATNLFVGVNPQTGQTLIGIRSGAAPTVPGANQPGQYIYPSQQINLTQGGDASAGNQPPQLLTQDELMAMLRGANPELLDEIVKNFQAIRDENNALLHGTSNAGQGNANYDENAAKMIDAVLKELLDSGLLTPEQRAQMQQGSSAAPPSGTARALSPAQQAELDAKLKNAQQAAAQRQVQQTQTEVDKKKAELLARQQQLRSNNPVPDKLAQPQTPTPVPNEGGNDTPSTGGSSAGSTPLLLGLPDVPSADLINQMAGLMNPGASPGGEIPLPLGEAPGVPLGDNGSGINPLDMDQLRLNQLISDPNFRNVQNPPSLEPPAPIEDLPPIED